MSSGCLFCNAANESTPEILVAPADGFYARADCFPCTPGHFEAIPVEHIANIQDLSETQWMAILPLLRSGMDTLKSTERIRTMYQQLREYNLNEYSVRYIADALEALQNGSIDLGQYVVAVNNGKAAGRTIHHLHVHLIPGFSANGELGNLFAQKNVLLHGQKDMVGGIPVLQSIHSNATFIAHLSTNSVSKGHIVISPKNLSLKCLKHFTDSEWGDLWSAMNTVWNAEDFGNPEAFNIVIDAGENSKFFAVHLIPRNAGDVENPAGGVRFLVPGKGPYKSTPEP